MLCICFVLVMMLGAGDRCHAAMPSPEKIRYHDCVCYKSVLKLKGYVPKKDTTEQRIFYSFRSADILGIDRFCATDARYALFSLGARSLLRWHTSVSPTYF